MKKILILSLLLFNVLVAAAQYTVTGTVVDKSGNPVFGALVTDTKSGASTTSGIDGGFTITSNIPINKLKGTYVGCGTDEKRAFDGVQLQLSPDSWWSSKATATWFIGPQALFPQSEIDKVVPGLTIGYVKRYGFYLKGFYWPEKDSDDDYSYYDWTTGKRNVSYWGGMGGIIARMHCPIYLYAGVGYIGRSVQYKLQNGDWVDDDKLDVSDGILVEAGLMLKVKHIMLNAGAVYNAGSWYDDSDYYYGGLSIHERFMVNVGVSYCF